MNKSKKKIILGVLGVVIAIVIVVFIFFFQNNKNEKNSGGNSSDQDIVLVKDNVNSITQKTKKEYQPIQVTADTLSFSSDPKYKKGDIIVSGVLENAPGGFIRRVTNVSEENGTYIYETENALLTDVFEKLYIVRSFALNQDSCDNIPNSNKNVFSVRDNSAKNGNEIEFSTQALEIKKDRKFLLKKEYEGIKLLDSLSLNGEIELDEWIEVKLSVKRGRVNFGIVTHSDIEGEIFLGFENEGFDKDKDEGEFQKEFLSKDLPTIEFAIAGVPIVITNEAKLTFDTSLELEGALGTTLSLGMKYDAGFEYDSKTGKVKEINEKTYSGKGIEWKTVEKASGSIEAGPAIHLVSKLYDAVGSDISVGIKGEIDGEIGAEANANGESELYGSLEYKVGPKIEGELVVEIPFIDKKLKETTLFEVKLKPFVEGKWEEKYEYDPVLETLKKGDFSKFAGVYAPTDETKEVFNYITDTLTINEDGSISSNNNAGNLCPDSPPISVEKNEDGSYLCILKKDTYHDAAHDTDEFGVVSCYTIYPIGIIEDEDLYITKDRESLKNTVYIKYWDYYTTNSLPTRFRLLDEAEDTTEPSSENNSIMPPLITDYAGIDWVETDQLNDSVGSEFISGTGIKYTVIGEETSVNNQRQRLIVESESGDKRMIVNMPAFEMDVNTGIAYYNIFAYESDPNYVEQ